MTWILRTAFDPDRFSLALADHLRIIATVSEIAGGLGGSIGGLLAKTHLSRFSTAVGLMTAIGLPLWVTYVLRPHAVSQIDDSLSLGLGILIPTAFGAAFATWSIINDLPSAVKRRLDRTTQ